MWARTRTTVQYFLIRSISREMDWPEDSECFLAYRVKAFFFDRYQFLMVRLAINLHPRRNKRTCRTAS